MILALIAAVLLEAHSSSFDFKVECDSKVIDPARSVFLRVEANVRHGANLSLPDFRDRAVGFLLAEDFEEEPKAEKDGSTTYVTNWRLIPEPCADTYKLKPFAIGGKVVGPLYFENPPPREAVTGEMELDLDKDLPPLSWKLVGEIALLIIIIGAVGLGGFLLIKYLARLIKEHRMSPIERAWVELERLIKKGLPKKGKYKDFYVELTMVVRRYIQRKYGINAPHMTTEEFLRAAKPSDELKVFLESADMVKFAGLTATIEMAQSATESARMYLKTDSAIKVEDRS